MLVPLATALLLSMSLECQTPSTDRSQEALAVPHEVEEEAGANADLFGALARAHRRAGDDRRALDYYSRARALATER